MRIFSIKNFIIFSALLVIIGFAIFKLAKTEGGIQSYFGQSIESDELNDFLSNKMQQYDIPGLSFGVINEGKLVFESYKGFANKEQKKPITKQTLFESASISKPVFSAFVMLHVEKGLLDLDKPLFHYYPAKYLDDPRYKKITARMALSHQTGWPNWRWDRKDHKLEFKHSPAEAYLYSGEGYQYLAETLRHIHGGSWQGLENAFQEWVAQPLNMKASTFIESYPVPDRKAHPYDKNSEAIDYQQLSDYKRNIGVYVAAASLITNVEDFSKWMVSIMEGNLLSPEKQKEMLTAQIGTGQSLVTEVMYTLGFFEMKLPGLVEVYGHGGNNHGFTGFFALNPDKKWGYVILTNSEYGEQLGAEALAYLLIGPNALPFILIASGFVLLMLTILFLATRSLYRLIKKPT